MPKKSNPLTRTQYIRSELGTPQSLAEFAEAVVAKFGGTVDEALADIHDLYRADNQIEQEYGGKDFLRAQLIAGTRAFYANAMAAGEYSAAGGALRALERLQGLDQPQQLTLDVSGSVHHDVTMVRDRIKTLIAQQSIRDKIAQLGIADDVAQLAAGAGVDADTGEPIAKPKPTKRRHYLGDNASWESPPPLPLPLPLSKTEPPPAKPSRDVQVLAAALAARTAPQENADDEESPVLEPALPVVPVPATRPPPEPRPHPGAIALAASTKFR